MAGKPSRGLAILVALLCAGASNAAIINIDATNATGATISLGAGTYHFQLIGTADGGAFDGWNAWGGNLGCDSNGGNCDNGFIEQFGYDLGNAGVFDQTNGRYFALTAVPGQTYRYDSGAKALPVYSAMIESSPLNANAYMPAPMPLTFTLASAQDVHFFIGDNPYYDNLGGISLSISAVPETANWAMMLCGFAMIGGALRSRRAPVVGFG